MLPVAGFTMIAAFLALIMTKKMSPIAALILIPALTCVLVGQGASLGDYVLDGVRSLAPTAAMLMFAIIYFGVMIDVGLFDPIVRGILRFCRADPLRVVLGTALLAAVVSLDGDGSTTFMITVSALLPLYQRLKMRVVVLTCVAATANGVLNTLPWGGPTARAASALHLDAGDIFVPMVPALAVGLAFVFLFAGYLGLRERRRLHLLTLDEIQTGVESKLPVRTEPQMLIKEGAAVPALAGGNPVGVIGGDRVARPDTHGNGNLANAGGGAGHAADGNAAEHIGLDPNRATLRPRLFWFNAALTIALLTLLILEALPIPVLFMIGAAIALSVNFLRMEEQKERIAAHADNIVNVSGMVFAAAVFTGVLTGTGMVEEMARVIIDAIPDALGPHMAIITGVLSLPLTYFMSNDGFYFGIVPVLAEAGAAHGVEPIEIARASLSGQMLHMSSPLVPAVYVLIGLAKVEFSDHIRMTVKWAALTCLVVLGAGVLFGTI
ncbi:CitMHS family transporter [Parafrankia sp. FMc2]|uniref:CitMHS family transporter n=1 Tax=Parafrankia sp. FMc2 TaxID=3233196 RepID=UPI0034D567B1